jgi:protein-S-isoprenylcysteine O-methyltransferase Ste14
MPDLKANSILVTSGPYKFIRHPMYAAVLLITLAVVLNHLTSQIYHKSLYNI